MELAEEKWGPDPRATSWEARCPPRREEGVEGTGQSRERGAEDTWVDFGPLRALEEEQRAEVLPERKDRMEDAGRGQASQRWTGTARPGMLQKACRASSLRKGLWPEEVGCRLSSERTLPGEQGAKDEGCRQ